MLWNLKKNFFLVFFAFGFHIIIAKLLLLGIKAIDMLIYGKLLSDFLYKCAKGFLDCNVASHSQPFYNNLPFFVIFVHKVSHKFISRWVALIFCTKLNKPNAHIF